MSRLERILLVQPRDNELFKDMNPFLQNRLACLAGAVEDVVDIRVADMTGKEMPWLMGQVETFDPQWIAITTPFIFSIPDVLQIGQAVRARFGPGKKIVVGGRSASSLAGQILAGGVVDAVVRGEGEVTFRELAQKATFEGILGVSWQAGGQIRHNPARPLIANLDDLPLPAYHLIDMGSVDIHVVETSRGCPFPCTFCEAAPFYERRWRARSPESVVRELKMLVDRYGTPALTLLGDDNIATDARRLKRICQLLVEEKYPVPLQMLTRATDIVRNPDLVPLLAEAGVVIVIIGLESGSQETLDRINKRTKLEQMAEASRLLRAHGIHVFASYIIGLPHETADMAAQTTRFATQVADSVEICLYTPLPGTPLYEQCRRDDLLLTEDWGRYDQYHQVVKTADWPEVDFEAVRDDACRLFYNRADWIKTHFVVRPGQGIVSGFVRGFSSTWTTRYTLNTLADWSEVFEGYRFVANEELAAVQGAYQARVRLVTESLTMDLPIKNGRLESVQAQNGPADLLIRTSDEVLNQLLRLMTQDTLSAVIEGKISVEAPWPDVAAFVRWCDTFQEVVDTQSVKRAPDEPTCLALLNETIAAWPEPKPDWLGQGGRYRLQTGGGDLVLGLRAGKADALRFHAGGRLRRIRRTISLNQIVLDTLLGGDFEPLLRALDA